MSEAELSVIIAGLALAGYRTVEIERNADTLFCTSVCARRVGDSTTLPVVVRFTDYREWVLWEHARILRIVEREERPAQLRAYPQVVLGPTSPEQPEHR